MASGREDAGQRKLAALTIGTALVAVMVLLIAQRWFTERAELTANVSTQAALIGANASAALVFDDQASAVEMLTALEFSPVVEQAVLYRADGSVLARFNRRAHVSGAPLDEISPARGVVYTLGSVRVTLPIDLHGKEVGRIAILATQSGVYGELLEFLAVFLVIALLASLLAYLATGRLRRRVALAGDQLEQSRVLLRQLIAHREQIIEEEHKRIAIEIHDQLGQNLTAALLNLRLIERSAKSLRAEEIGQIHEIENQLNEAYRGMKDIAAVLHPAVLQFGLVPALEWLAERSLKPAGIAWRLRAAKELPVLQPHELLVLFRIAQESLTNIVRHAAARDVVIVLRQTADDFVLEVFDDGRGFDPAAVDGRAHFGLAGMRERAQVLAARIEIDSAPGAGSCVRVLAPLVGLNKPFVEWDNIHHEKK